MPGRDDFGSRAGTPGGMGGSLGNGGVGGGMGGGMRGGGAGYNGGIGSRMGVTTGNVMRGTSAYGRPGGMAQGYGMNPAQARQAAMQGIMGKLMGMPQPTGARPPQAMPPAMSGLPPSMWMNNPTQRPYDPATSPAAYNPLASMMPRPPTMQDQPPVPPANFGTLAPGQPKYQDRVPSGVGPGNWAGQANGPHWGRTESAPFGGVGNRGNTGGGGGW